MEGGGGFGQNEVEQTGKVGTEKEENIPVSGQSMRGYNLTDTLLVASSVGLYRHCDQHRARRSKHAKGSKERCLLGQKHNLQTFGVILFVKLQNDT